MNGEGAAKNFRMDQHLQSRMEIFQLPLGGDQKCLKLFILVNHDSIAKEIMNNIF